MEIAAENTCLLGNVEAVAGSCCAMEVELGFGNGRWRLEELQTEG